MKALEFRKSIPRYALLKLLGSRCPRSMYARIAPITLRSMPPPQLPGPSWVRIAPRLAGICGSDLATICAKGSPYLAPVISLPFVLGHEVVGVITELGAQVQGLLVGDRVVIQPALGCKVRGIAPPCRECGEGRDALCRHVARGCISAGIQTGYCRDTGGGFSECLVAHESQVYRLPDAIDDRAAVLIEPFACALHGALRATPGPDDTALVIGCGAIGLLTIAALRATGCTARILAVAKYDHQRHLALALGASEMLSGGGPLRDRYKKWAASLDAHVLEPELGKPAVLGGADVVFDCIASAGSIDDGIRFTRSAGRFVLVGMPSIPRGIDWTPLWYKELTLSAAYAYGPERLADGVRPTFELAIELMREWADRLAGLLGRPFELADYRGAIRAALSSGQTGVAKTTFSIS
jgi:threonine dehydrogenase-like Zn-dependent dehydrogenase